MSNSIDIHSHKGQFDASLLEVFSSSALKTGKRFLDQGCVIDCKIDDENSEQIVSGTVIGRDTDYYVTLSINEARQIETFCSCSTSSYCHHSAAVMLAFQQQKLGGKERLETLFDPLATPLDTRLTDWFKERIESGNVPSARINQEYIIYCLTIEDSSVVVTAGMSHRLKHGSLSKPKYFDKDSPVNRHRMTTKDVGLLEQLDALYKASGYRVEKNRYRIKGAQGAILLDEIISSKRCYWQQPSQNRVALHRIEPTKIADITWHMKPCGTQQVVIQSEAHPDWVYLPVNPVQVIDPAAQTVCQLILPWPEHLIYALMHLPPVPPEQVREFRAAMMSQLSGLPPLPLPQTFDAWETYTLEPIPMLVIYKDKVPFVSETDKHRLLIDYRSSLVAQCYMVYGSTQTPIQDPAKQLRGIQENKVVCYSRHHMAEQRYFQVLKQLSLKTIENGLPYYRYNGGEKDYRYTYFIAHSDDLEAILAFKNQSIPILQKQGWQIESKEESFNYQLIEVEEWYSQLDETSRYDWFELQLGVIVDGKPINILPMLIEAIRTHQQQLPANIVIDLPNGQQLAIPKARMEQMTQVIYQLCDPLRDKVTRGISVARSKAMLVQEMQKAFQATKLRWLGSQELWQLSEKLNDFQEIASCQLPKAFKATLRQYQQDGVNWLNFLRSYRFNGILADDMGLGKTLQTLALLSIEKAKKRLKAPCLIIAPTSVVPNWVQEAKKFAPQLRVLMLQGEHRKTLYTDIDTHDIVLTSYALVIRDKDILLKTHYYYLILDEAHYIKNRQAKVTQVVHQLTADHRLCLTGTPIENHLSELWSQFNFLMPGLLNQYSTFKHRFQQPIEKNQDLSTQQLLNRLTKPFLLRRTKQHVLVDLPDKTEIIKTIELSSVQRDLYESVRLAMSNKVKRAIDQQGIERSHIVILEALLKLRQICCHPQLLKNMTAAKSVTQSTKFDALLEMLAQMLPAGRRILIFSQFTGMLALLAEELKRRGQPHVILTGSTRQRDQVIARFQNKEVPLFLISLKAGGVGLNLTAADTVIHYDPWWNPAMENQATDRAHRIGQKNPVFVYKLITANTVEEKILAMQEKKKNLAQALLSGGVSDKKMTLSKSDLDILFGSYH